MLGARAIVLGGSMAGLLAARVLADHFEEIAIVESDEKPARPAERKGVPQGRHVHTLLPRGGRALEALFPGIAADLERGGAVAVEFLNEAAVYQSGWHAPAPGRELRGLFMSRALLEWHVDRRVRALSNAALYVGRARGLRVDPGSGRATGISLAVRDKVGVESLDGDLVVDATGRGSRLSAWLLELGRPPAPVTEVTLPTVYASRVFERPSPPPPWKVLFVFPPFCGRRAGAVFPLEHNRMLATLVGLAGDEPPHTDDASFIDFARSLDVPDLHDAIACARPLTPIARHRFGSNRRRHYERCAALPSRLLVVGDAACSFNPRFGQGMTVAALEAEALGPLLAARERSGLDTLGQAFHQAAAPIIELAWRTATAEDLRYPEALGARPLALRALQWYSARILERMHSDAAIKEAFWRVNGLLDPPSRFLRPSFAARVLLPARRAAR